MCEVCTQVVCQLASSSIRHRNQILDTYGFLHLTTDTFGNHGYLQPFTGRIDSSRCSGRTSTEYQHIEVTMHRSGIIVSFFSNRWISRFQFFQQFTHRATTYMNHLSFGKHGRNGLYTKLIHFRLEESAIHHFMTNAWIKQSKDVKCLHYIRTIGTCERNISLQTDVSLQSTDATSNAFIRQVLTLSVSIEDSKKQRSKFMTIRNATESYACFFTVLQERKGERIAIYFVLFYTQTR